MNYKARSSLGQIKIFNGKQMNSEINEKIENNHFFLYSRTGPFLPLPNANTQSEYFTVKLIFVILRLLLILSFSFRQPKKK